jgi:hypothetical protein
MQETIDRIVHGAKVVAASALVAACIGCYEAKAEQSYIPGYMSCNVLAVANSDENPGVYGGGGGAAALLYWLLKDDNEKKE